MSEEPPVKSADAVASTRPELFVVMVATATFWYVVVSGWSAKFSSKPEDVSDPGICPALKSLRSSDPFLTLGETTAFFFSCLVPTLLAATAA